MTNTLDVISKEFQNHYKHNLCIKPSLSIGQEDEGDLYLESLNKKEDMLTDEEKNIYESIKSNGAYNNCINISKSWPTDDKFYTIFNSIKHYIKKELYPYQLDALRTMFYLEQTRKIVYNNDKTIISNGWQLGLPIGSGKSLVFMCLALFFNDIPLHNILLSNSGKNIPEFEIDYDFKSALLFYEKVGYNDKEENVVMEISKYNYRDITLIITHRHLLSQVKKYLIDDFDNVFLSTAKIKITSNAKEITENCKIIILEYTEENMKILRTIGFKKPFKRIILDDYVIMSRLEVMYQIPSIMTWFISGNGYLRSKNDLAYGYYSLAYAPFKDITLMGDPKKTLIGIERQNIFCADLSCYNTGFSIFKFIEEDKNRTDKLIYPNVILWNTAHDYLIQRFILNNETELKIQMQRIEALISELNVQDEDVYYYSLFKKLMDNIYIVRSLSTDISVINEANININNNFILNNKCYSCKELPDKTISSKGHNNWGMIATCCGAFYCEKCLLEGQANVINNHVTPTVIKFFKDIEDNIYIYLRNRMYKIINNIPYNEININQTYTFMKKSEIQLQYKYDFLYEEIFIIDKETNKNIICEFFNNTILYQDNIIIFSHNDEIIKIDFSHIKLKPIRCSACNKENPRYILNSLIKPNTSIKASNLISKVVDLTEIKSLQYKSKESFIKNMNIYETIFYMLLNGFELSIPPKNYSLNSHVFDSKDNIGLNILKTICNIIDKFNYNIQNDSLIILYGVDNYLYPYINNILNTMVQKYPKLLTTEYKKLTIKCANNLHNLIGLQSNILGIICWEKPPTSHNKSQLIGRLLRIGPTNPFYFYINLI